MAVPIAKLDEELSQLTALLPQGPYQIFQVSGPDAESFLQGQLTCDIQTAIPHHSQLGAVCNPQGRIRFLSRITQLHGHYYFRLPETMVALAIAALKKYALFSKVSIEPLPTWGVIGLIGANTSGLLDELIGGVPLEVNSVFHREHFIIIRVPGIEPSFEVWGDAHQLDIWIAQHQDKFKQRPTLYWSWHHIRAGIPEVYPETTERFLPHYINLPKIGAVSFTKGCYCGQEIIARMQYRAKIKRSLYQAEIDCLTEFGPGHRVLNAAGAELGTIVTHFINNHKRQEFLLELDDKAHEQGQPLSLEGEMQTHLTQLRPALCTWN